MDGAPLWCQAAESVIGVARRAPVTTPPLSPRSTRGQNPRPDVATIVGVQVTWASCRCERGGCSARDAGIVPQTLRWSCRNPHKPCANPHGWGDRWGGVARGTQAWEEPTRPMTRPIRSTPCRIGAGVVGQSAQLSWTTAHLTWNPTTWTSPRQSYTMSWASEFLTRRRAASGYLTLTPSQLPKEVRRILFHLILKGVAGLHRLQESQCTHDGA